MANIADQIIVGSAVALGFILRQVIDLIAKAVIRRAEFKNTLDKEYRAKRAEAYELLAQGLQQVIREHRATELDYFGDAPGFERGRGDLLHIQAQTGHALRFVEPVAEKAVVGQDRTNIAVEINFLAGPQRRSATDKQYQAGDQRPCCPIAQCRWLHVKSRCVRNDRILF